MAWLRKHKIAQQEKGQPISAEALRHAGESLDWLVGIQVSPPLEMLSTANGPLIRYPGMLFEVYIGITSTAITARSGSTPGSGRVAIQTWNGVVLQPLATDAVIAFNISSNPAGIAGGKYCIILKIAGSYFIITSEC